MVGVGKIEALEAHACGMDRLREAARAEGHRMLDRLWSDWAAGDMRFSGRGERLLGAWSGPGLVGVGGVTQDPVLPGALRLRRFYVLPDQRRLGVGRALATALLDHAQAHTAAITVNAQPASFPFWESLGFVPAAGAGITHARCAPASGT